MKLRRFLLLAALLSLAVGVFLPVRSGTGTWVSGTPDYINFNLYYTYSPADLAVMRNAFQEASRLLYNSTNGQVKMGTVCVSINSAFQDKADFWVNSGAEGASGAVGGFGTSGAHVTLFENRHKWTAEDGPDGNERGQFGIVHELGHYLFDLLDEYKYVHDATTDSAYCVTDPDTVCCIMDGGTQVHPNHHRTEWCTVDGGGLTTSHVTTPVTNQEAYRGCSCWETIASYCSSQYGVTLTAPTTVITGDPAGLGTVGWVTIGDRLRFVITIDRSYSMSASDKMTLAKQAAALFADLCRQDVDESLAVVSFSNTAVADFPMQAVTTVPDTRTLAKTAIDGIALENMTAMGDGLRTSLEQITGGGAVPADASAVEAIVLLTDGVHNYGTESPAAVLPDLCARGVRVFTIGLGDPSHPTYPLDEPTLLDLSSQTGANYQHAVAAADLASIYADYAAEIRGMDSYPEDTGELERGASRERKVLIDKYTKEAVFVIHWPYGDNAFQLKLKRPDGTVLTGAGAGIEEYLTKKHHIYYRIPKPMPGTWVMIATANRKVNLDQKKIRYTTQILAKAPGLCCRIAPLRAYFKPGEPATIRAFVSAGGVPIAKAQIYGTIRLPDGKRAEIKLYDDGDSKKHGDDRADDGVYSARFTATKTLGTYQAALIVNAVKPVTATPDEVKKGWVAKPMAPFLRAAKCTFSVGRAKVKPPRTEKR